MMEEIEYSYEDLCTECNLHDKCHRNGIDYDEIEKCNNLLKSDWLPIKQPKISEPKEKVMFT